MSSLIGPGTLVVWSNNSRGFGGRGWAGSGLAHPPSQTLYPQTCATKRPGGPGRCRGPRENEEKAASHFTVTSHHVRSLGSRRNEAAVTATCTFSFDSSAGFISVGRQLVQRLSKRRVARVRRSERGASVLTNIRRRRYQSLAYKDIRDPACLWRHHSNLWLYENYVENNVGFILHFDLINNGGRFQFLFSSVLMNL